MELIYNKSKCKMWEHNRKNNGVFKQTNKQMLMGLDPREKRKYKIGNR